MGFDRSKWRIPTTYDYQSAPNRPPMILVLESPQALAPTRFAGRCGLAGGRKRPPAFILHRFRPSGSLNRRLESTGFLFFKIPSQSPNNVFWPACGHGCCSARQKPTHWHTAGYTGLSCSVFPFSVFCCRKACSIRTNWLA